MMEAKGLNRLKLGDKALITTDSWFFAPDGKQYKAAYGTLKAIPTAEDALGITPNAKSTNWYVELGNLVIAGCQIHYVVKTDRCNLGETMAWERVDNTSVEYPTPCIIYNADKDYVYEK